jgi:NAD(P)-dependent dehydrogenase (short-subunit alcohol dehydrogenase family)
MSTCIVTGAAAGNGLAIAELLQEQGHRVIAIDRSPVPEGTGSVRFCGDVLDDVIISQSFAAALENGNNQVYLINNAGVTSPEFPQTDATWNTTIDVNLTAPFRWTREYAAHVTTNRITEGSVIFIGSLATATGFPRNPAYQASKAGIVGLTRSFAYDLGVYGIRVNCVSPGYIHTSMTNTSYTNPALHESRRRHTLLRRWGQSKDVANAVGFLCGPASTYITGVNLPVDGGWLACGLIED